MVRLHHYIESIQSLKKLFPSNTGVTACFSSIFLWIRSQDFRTLARHSWLPGCCSMRAFHCPFQPYTQIKDLLERYNASNFKHNLLSSYVQFCHWLQGLSEVHTPKVFHFTAWTNYVRIDDLRTRHVSTLKVTTWEKTGSVRFHGGKCWSLPLTNKLTLWSWFPNAFSCDKVHATVLRGAATSHPQTKSRCLSRGKMSSKGQGRRPS